MIMFLLGVLIGAPLGIMYYALVAINPRDDWK